MTRCPNDLGGYSAEVPPLPIPNRVVKLSIADGTACCGRVGSRHFQNLDIERYRGSLYMWRCCLLSFPLGSPQISNLWGERSTSEYLLLKRCFDTYTRIVPATGSRHFQSPRGFIPRGLFVCVATRHRLPTHHFFASPLICPSFLSLRFTPRKIGG